MKKKQFILILTISLVSWLLVIPAGITNASDVFFEIKPELDMNKPPNKEERSCLNRFSLDNVNMHVNMHP